MIIQEIWAVGSRYVLGKDIADKKIYIFTKLFYSTKDLSSDAFNMKWRYGIYRAESLVGQSTLLGYYSLLVFTIYIFFQRRINWIVFVLILSGVLASGSRMVYTALAFIFCIFIFKDKKRFLFLLIPLLIVTGYMGIITADIDSFDLQGQSYRSYARDKSIEIWKDHAFWGVGPGKYGGTISVKFPSHIYEEYNFSTQHLNQALYKWHSLDQFWPQVLAETGIIGFLCLIGIFVSVICMLFRLKYQAGNDKIRDLLTGMTVFMVAIYIHTLGSGLNVTPVVFTYLAFVGMALGCSDDQYENNN